VPPAGIFLEASCVSVPLDGQVLYVSRMRTSVIAAHV